MDNRFVLIGLFVVGVSFFNSCCASQQNSDNNCKIVRSKNNMKIQSDLSAKELNLLDEEQKNRLDSSFIHLDVFPEIDEIEVDEQRPASQVVYIIVENPILAKKS